MRRLEYILSDRETLNYPSIKIVYEWEDILVDKLGLKLIGYSSVDKLMEKICRTKPVKDLYLKLLPKKSIKLHFVMRAATYRNIKNSANVIPVIIDYWLKNDEIPAFFKAYKNVPLMLVTNREVYNLLNRNNPPFPIEHWPLSLPDKCVSLVESNQSKKYDFCLFGRPNPFFINMMEEYAKRHEDFVYLVTKGTEKNREYYTNKGEFVCKDEGRKTYLEMIKRTRISCYSTPGIDSSKSESDSFNQVTPRLFEMLGNGCMVIGHYPLSDDTEWYDLPSIVPNVNTYGEFEKVMDEMRSGEYDFSKEKDFVLKHLTSNRADMLKDILAFHNIGIL